MVILYQPDSYGDCIQALGRGSRSLAHVTSGTIICAKPVVNNPAMYLDVLQARDVERSESQELNTFVCRLLNGKKATGEMTEKVKNFKKHCETYENFRDTKKPENQELWGALRTWIGPKLMPQNVFNPLEQRDSGSKRSSSKGKK